MKDRQVLHTIRAMETSDGAGVRLKRALGQNPAVRLDPFLMLDAFSSDNPDDYIAGFRPTLIGDSRPSPTWWKVTCATAITWVTRVICNRAVCSG